MELDNLMHKRILFFDLDGTLIETESGNTFPHDISDMKIKRNVWLKIKAWADNSFDERQPRFIFIVTNQGGIEKGIVRQSHWIKKIEYIVAALHDYLGNSVIVDYIMCDSNDKDNKNRKPNNGMLLSILGKYSYWIEGTDNSKMAMIGDASGKQGQFSDSDKKCADNFKIDYADVSDFCNINIEPHCGESLDINSLENSPYK